MSWLLATPTPSATAAYFCLGMQSYQNFGSQQSWVGINAVLTVCATRSSLLLTTGRARLPLSVEYGAHIQQLRDLVSVTVANPNCPLLAWRSAVRIAKHRLVLGRIQGEPSIFEAISPQLDSPVKGGHDD